MISIKKRIYNNKLDIKDLVLDIETTGLDINRDKLVLLGIVKRDANKTYIYQYFAENDDEETRLLNIYLREVEYRRLITFNGDNFDIRFLNARLIDHKLFPVFPDQSLDIYKVIKWNSKFFSYDSMRLVDIEKLIGIEREDPSRYKVISKLTNDLIRRENPFPIIKHNENDLISTAALATIEEIYKKKLSVSTKIGEIYLYNANINKDIGNFEFRAYKHLDDLYVAENNYQLIIKDDIIKLNIHVLFGKFNNNITGFVTINNFAIKNISDIEINDNLLIIRESNLYNYHNLLNLCKKIIENHSWFSIFQSISFILWLFKKSFVLEKGFDPKKPLLADKGDGWDDSIIRWFWLLINSFLDIAKFPQRIKTKGSFLEFRDDIILSVKICHPMFLCELGFLSSTVRLAFNNKTPCLAQAVSEPLFEISSPKSFLSSLYIFFKDGGMLTPGFTEKDKPSACP